MKGKNVDEGTVYGSFASGIENIFFCYEIKS